LLIINSEKKNISVQLKRVKVRSPPKGRPFASEKVINV